jgi:hypothetical protein
MNASRAAGAALAVNMTLQEYLEDRLGVQTLPLHVVIPITVLYVLISITGIVGNVVVCMVIAKHPNMHTATNYYLFSLAVADVTILVFGECLFAFLFFQLMCAGVEPIEGYLLKGIALGSFFGEAFKLVNGHRTLFL